MAWIAAEEGKMKKIQELLSVAGTDPIVARRLVRLARLVAWWPWSAWWLRALAGARPGRECEAAEIALTFLHMED